MQQPVLVCGVSGRMAQLVGGAVSDSSNFELLGYWSIRNSEAVNQVRSIYRDTDALLRRFRPVVIDFTHPTQTMMLLKSLEKSPCPIIIGTSGLVDEHYEVMRRIAKQVPVVASANFSIGVMLSHRLIKMLAETAPSTWTADYLDVHHAKKIDAPSATAVALRKTWNESRNPAQVSCNDIASLRFGDGVSEHTVFVAGKGERIEITHRLLSRSAIVSTVLDIAGRISKLNPGIYTLDELYS